MLWSISLLFSLALLTTSIRREWIYISTVAVGTLVTSILPLIAKVKKPQIAAVLLSFVAYLVVASFCVYFIYQIGGYGYLNAINLTLLCSAVGFSVCVLQSVLIFESEAVGNLFSGYSRMWKTFLIILFAVIVLTAIIKIVLFPTSWKYCDKYIIGSTAEKITDRYGSFHNTFYSESGELQSAVYIIRPRHEGLFGIADEEIYCINFKNGVAVSVSTDDTYSG